MIDNDERSIRNLMAETTNLWIRHEMDAWGKYFTEDADFIAHSGLWWTSRDENVKGHKNIPESLVARKKTYRQDVEAIREVTPDVALVHTRWSWDDRSGVITYVLVKRRGRWLIRAAHNTRGT